MTRTSERKLLFNTVKPVVYEDVEMNEFLTGWFYHDAQRLKGDRHQIHFPHAESWQEWFILFCVALNGSQSTSHMH